MSLRDFIKKLEHENEIKRIEEKVSPRYEIAKKLKNSEKVLLFENVANHEIEVIGNLYGTRKRIGKGLSIEQNQLIDFLRNSLSSLKKPKTTTEAPIQEMITDDVNLKKLPILHHFEKDGGPYVTSSILVGKDPEGNRNLSFHRLQLIDDDKFSVRLVPRNLHSMFKKAEDRGESLDVAAVIGVDPAVALAAATSPPYEVDEYEIAESMSNQLKLVKCLSNDLEVPSDAEIVFEGKLLAGERAQEGPFADITGTYDAVRQQPVFEVEKITRRKDAFYQALLPGSSEHQYLMGIPREPLIFEEVEKVARVDNAVLTPGGCGWLHGVISINKQNPDEGKKAIDAAFEAHPSMKHVVVVDEDIDIYDPEEVEWAIATRSRADEDVMILSDVKGSSLDPTADSETRLGSKMGIDATKDLDNYDKFEKANIPD